MTGKVSLAAVATAALVLVGATGATAAPPDDIRSATADRQIRSAAFQPLTPRTARRLAVRLARSSARERNVRWWTLSEPVSVSRTRVAFDYGDRTRDVFCTARIVVEQPTRRFRRMRFTGAICRGVPSEALAMERATSRLLRAARGRSIELVDSLARFDDELAECEEVRVPRDRRDDVRRLFLAREALAAIEPLSAQIDAFVTALQQLRITRAALIRGVRGWRDFDAGIEELALQTADAAEPCDAVRRWRSAGWSAAAAPVDFEAVRRAIESLRSAERAIERAAVALAELGVSPRVVIGFTPEGLVEMSLPRALP